MAEYSITDYINLSWLYWIIVTIYSITILSIVAIILSENRNPVKSLAWVTVLLLLPAIGLVLYIFFGRSIKNTHMISRRNQRRLKRNYSHYIQTTDIENKNLSPESIQQINLTRSLNGSRFYTHNGLKIYTTGNDKFKALKNDLLKASKYINLQYYIFEDDAIGTEIKDILIKKAREGVKVRVMYDHVGSFQVKNNFFKEMENAGIMTHPFFKVSVPVFATRVNWRNHRKICIIDGEIGYIGGMNIADRYLTGGKFPSWRDTHLRVTGPILSALQYSFTIDWNFLKPALAEEDMHTIKPTNNTVENIGMQLLSSGPTCQWSNIALVFLKAISNAKRSILIQTPYFLPTESLLKALQSAALSNVKVRIMLPRRSDSNILRYASYSYIDECIKSGIKFYLYDAGMLHSKTIVIDNEFCTIGSTNFDFRSFEHNFECNLFIYSQKVNTSMREIFAEDLKHSTRINKNTWKRRPLTQKIAESITRLLSPIL